MDMPQNPNDDTMDATAAIPVVDGNERPANDGGQSVDFPSIRRRGPNVRYADHFTLRIPTSEVRYRGDFIHVYDLRASQIQFVTTTSGTEPALNAGSVNSTSNTSPNHVRQQQQQPSVRSSKGQGDEETQINAHSDTPEVFLGGSVDNNEQKQLPQSYEIQLRHVPNDRATGLSLLRLTYTVVALFFTGILFIFSFLVILYLFMDLVAYAGLTGDDNASWSEFVGTLLAIPVFLYGLSSLLTVAGFFVVETWNGHDFMHTVGNLNRVVIEWVTLLMMLGAPLAALIMSLFVKSDDWWTVTFYTWFSSVTVYFTVFAFIVVYYETQSAWLIVEALKEPEEGEETGGTERGRLSKVFYFISDSIRRKMNRTLSGEHQKIRVSGGATKQGEEELIASTSCFRRWYTNMTLARSCGCLFEPVSTPERIYSADEIFGKKQFLTRNNWSMESLLCSNRRTSDVATIRGPAALTEGQILSSVVFMSTFIVGSMLLVVALLVWANAGAGLIVIAVALLGCCSYPRWRTGARFWKAYKKMKSDDGDTGLSSIQYNDNDDGVYQSFETYRVSRPRKNFRISLFCLCCGLLFIWPMITLLSIGNYAVCAVFIVIAIWSFIRYWLDPCVLLQDLGNFDVIGKSDRKNKWKVQSRVSTIMMNVTNSPGTDVWMWILVVLIVIIFIFSLSSMIYQNQNETAETDNVTDDTYYDQEGESYWPNMVLTPPGAFKYPPQSSQQYPSCRLFQGLELPGGNSTGLADYAFLATLIYSAPESLQGTLDEWFGSGVATLESELVTEFRKNVYGGGAAVEYNVVSFYGGALGVVLVRGSTSSWEWLTNAQLWSSVAFVQVVQYLLPAGEIFNPINSGLLKAMSFFQSTLLSEVALYRQTTALVNYMRDIAGFNESVHITGQSLGGGIALITGAQTGIPAIAISGPNDVFSRETFDPPLDLDTINSMLFNVIPERDIVPLVDKPGLLTQHIACRAYKNDLFGCHTATRSLCEIMYKCGSYNRPPLCECATKYGYPDAEQISGNQTFSDVCGTSRSNDGWYA